MLLEGWKHKLFSENSSLDFTSVRTELSVAVSHFPWFQYFDHGQFQATVRTPFRERDVHSPLPPAVRASTHHHSFFFFLICFILFFLIYLFFFTILAVASAVHLFWLPLLVFSFLFGKCIAKLQVSKLNFVFVF